MKVNKLKILKLIFIVLVLINIGIQALFFVYTKGINSHLLLSIVILGCILLYNITIAFKSNMKTPKLSLFVISIFIVFMSLVSFVYAPKLTYNQAQTIVLEDFSDEIDVKILEIEMETITLEEPFNLFVSKEYMVAVVVSSEVTYYVVNPYDRSVMKTDLEK